MSSPADTPLPPPPSKKIDNVNPGNQPHNKWEAISIHTAKCDVCSEHNTSVIQRCTSCNRQLCKKCIPKVGDDGVHSANVDELDWVPQTRTPVSRRRGSGRLAAKDKASALTPANNKVCKTVITSRRSTRATRERLLNEVEKRGSSTDDLFVEGREKQSFASGSNYDPDYDPGSETEEDPLLEERVREADLRLDAELTNTGSSKRGGDELPTNGSSKKSVRWADAEMTPSRVDKGKGREDLMQPSGLPRGPAPYLYPKASTSSSLAHLCARATQFDRPSSLPLPGRGPRGPFEIGNIRPHPQGGFSEIIARLAQDKDEERQKKEAIRKQEAAKAKERAYQFEWKAAWEHDPTILALRRQSKEDEAKELMEAAGALIRSIRGL